MATAQSPPGAAAWRRLDTSRAAWAVLALGLIAGVMAIMYAGRNLTFFYDEWNYVAVRLGRDWETFMVPHNEHASVVPLVVFKSLFAAFGLTHYWVYRLVHAALMAVTAVLVYVYGRPRLGRWWALMPALALAVVGSSPEYVLWTFQLSFTLPLIGFIGALLALDRGRDWIASALLVMAVFSSGIGISVLAAVGVEIALRADRRQRARVLVAPVVLYVIWWLVYHEGSNLSVDHLLHVPRFVEQAYVTAVASLTSLSSLAGPAALVLAVLVVIAALGPLGRMPRFWCLVAAPLFYWTSTALLRYGISPPASDRYRYPGAVLLALLMCEIGRYYLPRVPVSGRLVLIVGALLVVLVANNAGVLQEREGTRIPEHSEYLRPELGALELARGAVRDQNFRPDAGRAPDLTAANYFEALDAHGGSPALGPDEIASTEPFRRAAADAVLFGALAPAVEPVPAPPPGCAARPTPAALEVRAPALYLDNRDGREAATIALRRFADAPQAPLSVPPGTVGRVALPTEATDAHPFLAQVDGRRATACAA